MATLAVAEPEETLRVLMEACGQLRMEGSMSPGEARWERRSKLQIMCLFEAGSSSSFTWWTLQRILCWLNKTTVSSSYVAEVYQFCSFLTMLCWSIPPFVLVESSQLVTTCRWRCASFGGPPPCLASRASSFQSSWFPLLAQETG